MEDIKKFLVEWGLNPIALAGGIVGAIISIVIDEKITSFKEAVAYISCALAFSGWGTEYIAIKINIVESPSTLGLIGLCFGICGLHIAKGVKSMSKKFARNPEKYIKVKKTTRK